MLYDEIRENFCNIGLKKGDLIFTQSSLLHFMRGIEKGSRKDLTRAFCDALFDVVGTSGTVCFPAFSYSLSQREVYKPDQPLSSAMGALPKTIFETKKCTRTMDPMFSVGVSGSLEEDLTKDVPLTCFGKNSFYDRFYKKNGKILQIGLSSETIFLTYAEQKHKCPYRYFKRFSGKVEDGNNTYSQTWVSYVRRLDGTVFYNFAYIEDLLRKKNCLKSKQFLG
jgi:aminoglycoside 3-N-acetyltransferase